MNLFNKRPLSLILCVMLGGFAIFTLCGWVIKAIAAAILLTALALSFTVKKIEKSKLLFIRILAIPLLLCIALSICLHSAANGRLSKSRLVLHDVATQAETAETNDFASFVGKEGESRTVLRPAGIAEFDGVKLNVVSDGEYIANGARVVVDRVEGNRIVVRELKA